ncbi:purine and uridine phosphorylase [Viridothelium virens]|uniref:Purine and uridine phosphorylase n=1 Tax=Viridothelium virens TaxID=1048519 RepID=A0A6A6H5Q9_VIRVR|nr:purine and uridine phosphorylase [Viridothelium virens]
MVECNKSLNGFPCGETCRASWQYRAFSGQSSELATASPNDTLPTITTPVCSSTQTTFSKTTPLISTIISLRPISKRSGPFTTSVDPSLTAPFNSVVLPTISLGNNTTIGQDPATYHSLGIGAIVGIVLGPISSTFLILLLWLHYRLRNPPTHRRPLNRPADGVVELGDRDTRNRFNLSLDGVALNSSIETPEVLQEANFAEEVSRGCVERGVPPIHPPHPNQPHQEDSQIPLHGHAEFPSGGEPDQGEEQPRRRMKLIEKSTNDSGPSSRERRRLERELPIFPSHPATIAHNDENDVSKKMSYHAQSLGRERQPLENKSTRQQLNPSLKERSASTQEYPKMVSSNGKESAKEAVDLSVTLPLLTQFQDPIGPPKNSSPPRRTRSTTGRSLGTRAQYNTEAGSNPYSKEDSGQDLAVPVVQNAAIPEPRQSEATDRTSRIEDWMEDVRGPATRSLARPAREKTNRIDSGFDRRGSAKREERGQPRGRRLRSTEYTVGLICALFTELSAVRGALDEEHEEVSHSINDSNTYTLGRMAGHNVVLACLPNGQYGTNPAAAVATALRFRFRSVRIGLLVGIGGGVPSQGYDIRLGDVVVSEPTAQHGGVIQYDRGKVLKDNDFQRTGYLQSPPTVLLTAVSKLRSNHVSRINNLGTHLSKICRNPYFAKGKGGADYLAIDDQVEADPDPRVASALRQHRDSELPHIHYGAIASGNEVIKNGRVRDRISEALGGVLCFEMEAAGLMNIFPCIVIRGICDYADTHKNKDWQPYAAAAAAAYAKELLSVTHPAKVVALRTAFEVASDSGHD